MKIKFRNAMRFSLRQYLGAMILLSFLVFLNCLEDKYGPARFRGWPFPMVLQIKKEIWVEWNGIIANAWIAICIVWSFTGHFIDSRRKILSAVARLAPVAFVLANNIAYQQPVNFGPLDRNGIWPTNGWPYPFFQAIGVGPDVNMSYGIIPVWDSHALSIDILVCLIVCGGLWLATLERRETPQLESAV